MYIAELRGGQQFRGWDDERYLQAASVQALRDLTYVTLCANSGKKKPEPLPPVYTPKTADQVKKAKQHKPGSFAFIAGQKLKAARARKGLASG